MSSVLSCVLRLWVVIIPVALGRMKMRDIMRVESALIGEDVYTLTVLEKNAIFIRIDDVIIGMPERERDREREGKKKEIEVLHRKIK